MSFLGRGGKKLGHGAVLRPGGGGGVVIRSVWLRTVQPPLSPNTCGRTPGNGETGNIGTQKGQSRIWETWQPSSPGTSRVCTLLQAKFINAKPGGMDYLTNGGVIHKGTKRRGSHNIDLKSYLI